MFATLVAVLALGTVGYFSFDAMEYGGNPCPFAALAGGPPDCHHPASPFDAARDHFAILARLSQSRPAEWFALVAVLFCGFLLWSVSRAVSACPVGAAIRCFNRPRPGGKSVSPVRQALFWSALHNKSDGLIA